MRLVLITLLLVSLQNVGYAQLTSSTNERRLPGEFKRTAEIPAELAETKTLAYVDFLPIFDGGSYGARFRRDDGHHLDIYFLHPGFWTKQAIKNKTQPIVVDLHQDEEKLKLEVEPNSQFEKRLIKLLNDGLSSTGYTRKQVKTLTAIRDCIRDRTPLREIRRRFRGVFRDSPD